MALTRGTAPNTLSQAVQWDEAAYWGGPEHQHRRPSSPTQAIAGQPQAGAPTAPAQPAVSAAAAAVWLGRKVSGTEVYFKGELTGTPVHTHHPGHNLGGFTKGGKDVETSLSHSPFVQFLS